MSSTLSKFHSIKMYMKNSIDVLENFTAHERMLFKGLAGYLLLFLNVFAHFNLLQFNPVRSMMRILY